MIIKTKSTLEKYRLFQRDIYIKRDDLLGDDISVPSGNKARKFKGLNLALNQTLISYGGNQSNALLTLSIIAKNNDSALFYVTPKLSKTLEKNLEGNLAAAIQNGAKIIQLERADTKQLREYALSLSRQHFDSVFISQGGDKYIAYFGMKDLAMEIEWQINELKINNPSIFYSVGKGTSLLALRKHTNLSVYGLDCVGELYQNNIEDILYFKDKIAFGRPAQSILDMYYYLLERTGIEFDLLYDCPGFVILKENIDKFTEKDIIFIHSGGLLGNITQKKRYKYKKILYEKNGL